MRDVPLEDYVAAAALSEFAPAPATRAAVEAMFEVQAIVARTYAEAHRGRHARDGLRPLLDHALPDLRAGRLRTSRVGAGRRATPCSAHAGLILAFDGGAGRRGLSRRLRRPTSAAADVWGGAGLPYLPAPAGRRRGERRARRVAVRRRRATRCSARSTPTRARASADGSIAIAVLARDASGRAARLVLRARHERRDVTVRGTDLREVLTAAFGARSIRSTLFDVGRDGRRVRVLREGLRPRRRPVPGRARSRASTAGEDAARRCCDALLSRARAASDRTRRLTLRRHRVHDQIDGELRVVLALEALVPPVVVPLAAVVLVAVEHAEPAAVLERRAGSRGRSRRPTRSARARSSADRSRT